MKDRKLSLTPPTTYGIWTKGEVNAAGAVSTSPRLGEVENCLLAIGADHIDREAKVNGEG